MDPTDPASLRVLENLMHLEVEATEGLTVDRIGDRVYVRFSHGTEPLGYRLVRGARRLFLRQFSV